jgi:hypothetical protein
MVHFTLPYSTLSGRTEFGRADGAEDEKNGCRTDVALVDFIAKTKSAQQIN